MFIERPPGWFRALVPGGVFRMPPDSTAAAPVVYLTFDDGPIPEMTPLILDILRDKDVKATFFMVGDNVRKYPHLLDAVLAEGHAVGNHTMHHLQGIKVPTSRYLQDIAEAAEYIPSRLFRPPHGLLRPRQATALAARYRIIMYDLVTRDYSSRLTPEQVLHNACRYARSGSIIVFHDSLKSRERTLSALPKTIDRLREQGYSFSLIN